MRTAPAVFLAAALLAGPALAEDAPVATARPDTAMTTAEQIDAYLKSSPVLETEAPGGMAGVVPSARGDGKIHGEVSVGVGTGGYRSVYARTEMPLGESGRLSLAFEDTRFGRGRGYGYAPGRFDRFGAGLSFGADRQRCDLEGLTPPRPMDDGRASRCARGVEVP
ncbi:MAG: hypothetical protein AB1942_17785 [Pseudomonadota bacterium]